MKKVSLFICRSVCFLTLGLSLSGILSGCEMTGQLKEMHDSTGAMNSKMDSMNTQMDKTVQGVSATNDTSCNMLKDLLQGNTRQARQEVLDSMGKVSSMDDKIDRAGQFFMAFEFQLWEPACDSDTNKTAGHISVKLEHLYEDAANEFFREVANYLPDVTAQIDPTASDEATEDFLALSAAVHLVNTNQIAMNLPLKRQNVSMLSLIEDTLKKKKAADEERLVLQAFEHIIMFNEDKAVALLRARSNFLPVMLLSKIINVQNANILSKLWMLKIHSDAKFSQLNKDQVIEYTTWIHEANREISFLKSLGYEPSIHSNVTDFYKHMNLPEPTKTNGSQEVILNRRHSLEVGLLSEINIFKKSLGL